MKSYIYIASGELYSINYMSFYNAIVRACVFLSETLMLLAAGACLNTIKYIGLGKENYIYIIRRLVRILLFRQVG